MLVQAIEVRDCKADVSSPRPGAGRIDGLAIGTAQVEQLEQDRRAGWPKHGGMDISFGVADQGAYVRRVRIPLEDHLEAKQVAIEVERAIQVADVQTDMLSGSNRPLRTHVLASLLVRTGHHEICIEELSCRLELNVEVPSGEREVVRRPGRHPFGGDLPVVG